MIVHGIGGNKWAGAEEIPTMQWDPMCVDIVKQITEMLEKQHYRMTAAIP